MSATQSRSGGVYAPSAMSVQDLTNKNAAIDAYNNAQAQIASPNIYLTQALAAQNSTRPQAPLSPQDQANTNAAIDALANAKATVASPNAYLTQGSDPYLPPAAQTQMNPAPVVNTNPAPVVAVPPVTTPPPVTDFRDMDTFKEWQKTNDATNATAQSAALDKANTDWQTKYNTLDGKNTEAQAGWGAAKQNLTDYTGTHTNDNASFNALKANYDAQNKDYADLQKNQANAISNGTQQGGNLSPLAPVNMQNYNDNRNAGADQWWSKYLTGRR